MITNQDKIAALQQAHNLIQQGTTTYICQSLFGYVGEHLRMEILQSIAPHKSVLGWLRDNHPEAKTYVQANWGSWMSGVLEQTMRDYRVRWLDHMINQLKAKETKP